jgi:16S rRNA (uracil1498-N3)-methyltransferase
MRQLLLPGERSAGQQLELTGDDYHYLARVLRLRPGDTVPAMDEAGTRWIAALLSDDGVRLLVRVDPMHTPHVTLPAITVYQAIPKGRKLDEPLRQLVQAGVTRICPIVTERTIVRAEGGSARLDRWRRIAREAVQQSGAERPAEVVEPLPLRDVRAADRALSLFLHTEPLAQTTLHGYLGDTPSVVELVVGPEGGFSESEIDTLRAAGFSSLWLGPQVLRTESAALFAVAAVRILVLERAHWQPADQ